MTKEAVLAAWGVVVSLVVLLLTVTTAPVAANTELPFFPGESEILGSSRASAAEALENLVNFIDAAQWQTFLASGAVSDRGSLIPLRKARDILDGGEEVKSREGKPLPDIGLLAYFDYVQDTVKRVRLGTEAPATASFDRDRALRCLENARKLAESAGEVIRSTLEKPEDVNPTRKAQEARILFYQVKNGLDIDGDGEISGGECGLYGAGNIFTPLRD